MFRGAGAPRITFDGAPAYQVGEGEVQGPLRGEIGLCHGAHTLAGLQQQPSALAPHSPGLGQLWGGELLMLGGSTHSRGSPGTGDSPLAFATVLGMGPNAPGPNASIL